MPVDGTPEYGPSLLAPGDQCNVVVCATNGFPAQLFVLPPLPPFPGSSLVHRAKGKRVGEAADVV